MDNLFEDIEDAFSGFGWENVLEIGFITLVIYFLLRLISGTTAMTVVRGISILAVLIVVLSRALDSVVLDWVVNNAIAVLVIFVLIVFQPEFRRALERVGRAGGVRSWLGVGRDPSASIVHTLARTAERLSTHRRGALIVLERDTGLQEVVDTGVPLHADVSTPLLENIFFPNSPLHDGAVVLRDGRIVAAACILPTSDYEAAGLGHLGTRHRAALGISERTDAVVIVVSEETGGISLALGGRLIRTLDAERLEALLLPLFTTNGRGNGRDRDGSRTLTVPGS